MSAAREEILGRVRAALGEPRPGVAASRAYRRAGGLDARARVDLFAARVADYRAEVRRVEKVELDGRLAVPAGLPAEWRPADAVVDDGLSLVELDAVEGVVTGCTLAIAETGTIILSGGPEEGRRALTLVPDLHICVIREEQIVQTVPEAFDGLAAHAARPLTFISGPSATSDIELRRVEGVHGPRRLVVVIVEGASGD